VAVDGLEPNYSVLRSPLLPPPSPADESVLLPCRLWGNSNRDGDLVHKAAMLPQLRDGDWLMFPFAGAYTICAASNYGGVRFTQPLKVFVYSSEAVRECGSYDVQVRGGGCGSGQAVWHRGHVAAACIPLLKEWQHVVCVFIYMCVRVCVTTCVWHDVCVRVVGTCAALALCLFWFCPGLFPPVCSPSAVLVLL
jgi:hypothetical protein